MPGLDCFRNFQPIENGQRSVTSKCGTVSDRNWDSRQHMVNGRNKLLPTLKRSAKKFYSRRSVKHPHGPCWFQAFSTTQQSQQQTAAVLSRETHKLIFRERKSVSNSNMFLSFKLSMIVESAGIAMLQGSRHQSFLLRRYRGGCGQL